jgi:hypothetical protein
VIGPIGILLEGAVDGYAAIERADSRRAAMAAATERVERHRRAGRPRALVVVKTPEAIRGLSSLKTGSAVVVVDCALERCADEADLRRCWGECVRASGSGPGRYADLFVVRIQRWAGLRLALDPRVRFVIRACPTDRSGDELKFEPYGRRSTVLADTRRWRLYGQRYSD